MKRIFLGIVFYCILFGYQKIGSTVAQAQGTPQGKETSTSTPGQDETFFREGEEILPKRYPEADEAAKNFQLSAKMHSLYGYLKKGWEAVEHRNFPLAEQYFKEAKEIDPKNVSAVKAPILLMDMRGDTRGAIAKLNEALKQDHKNRINFISSRVAMYTKLGMYEEALKDSEESLTFDSKVPSYWYNHARLLTKLKRYKEAAESYQKSIDLGGSVFTVDKFMCREIESSGVACAACAAAKALPGGPPRDPYEKK